MDVERRRDSRLLTYGERLLNLRSQYEEIPKEDPPKGQITKLPRIVLKDSLGNKLNTYTVLQEALCRAEWNVKQTKEAKTAEEWRLPHAPLPSRPDYSRATPSTNTLKYAAQRKSDKNGGSANSSNSHHSRNILDVDIDDVAFVKESLNRLPKVPSLAFLHQEFLCSRKEYLQIVGEILLHKKYLTQTDKRDAVYHFPGFCSGCRRSGLCYGCERSSEPHFHVDGLIFSESHHQHHSDHLSSGAGSHYANNWRVRFPELALKNLVRESDQETRGLKVLDDGRILLGVDPRGAGGDSGGYTILSEESLSGNASRAGQGYLKSNHTASDQDPDQMDVNDHLKNLGQLSGKSRSDRTDVDSSGKSRSLINEEQRAHGVRESIEGDHRIHGNKDAWKEGSPGEGKTEGRIYSSQSGNVTGDDTVSRERGGHFGDGSTDSDSIPHFSDSEKVVGSERNRKTDRSDSSSGHYSQHTHRTSGQEEDDGDDDESNEELEDGSGSSGGKKRRRLYKAPMPFRLKKTQHRKIESKSPFSSERNYNLPTGKAWVPKKNTKKPTQFVDFEHKEIDWKEPKKFTVKQSDKSTTEFWSPTHKDKDSGKKKTVLTRKKIQDRVTSPDSGLESEKVEGLRKEHCSNNEQTNHHGEGKTTPSGQISVARLKSGDIPASSETTGLHRKYCSTDHEQSLLIKEKTTPLSQRSASSSCESDLPSPSEFEEDLGQMIDQTQEVNMKTNQPSMISSGSSSMQDKECSQTAEAALPVVEKSGKSEIKDTEKSRNPGPGRFRNPDPSVLGSRNRAPVRSRNPDPPILGSRNPGPVRSRNPDPPILESSNPGPLILRSMSGAISPIYYESSNPIITSVVPEKDDIQYGNKDENDEKDDEESDDEIEPDFLKTLDLPRRRLSVHVPLNRRRSSCFSIPEMEAIPERDELASGESGKSADSDDSSLSDASSHNSEDRQTDSSSLTVCSPPPASVETCSVTSVEPNLDLIFDNVLDIETLPDYDPRDERIRRHGIKKRTGKIKKTIEGEDESDSMGLSDKKDFDNLDDGSQDDLDVSLKRLQSNQTPEKRDMGTRNVAATDNSQTNKRKTKKNRRLEVKSKKGSKKETDDVDFSLLPSIKSIVEKIVMVNQRPGEKKSKNLPSEDDSCKESHDHVAKENQPQAIPVICLRPIRGKDEEEAGESANSETPRQKTLQRSTSAQDLKRSIKRLNLRRTSTLASIEIIGEQLGEKEDGALATKIELPKFPARFKPKKTKTLNPKRVPGRTRPLESQTDDTPRDVAASAPPTDEVIETAINDVNNDDLKDGDESSKAEEQPPIIDGGKLDVGRLEDSVKEIPLKTSDPKDYERTASPASLRGITSPVLTLGEPHLSQTHPSPIVERPQRRERSRKTKREKKPPTPIRSATPHSPKPLEDEPVALGTPEPEPVAPPTIPELPPIEIPALPEYVEEKKVKWEKKEREKHRFPLEPIPKPSQPEASPPTKKSKPTILVKSKPSQWRRPSKAAEAPVTPEEITQMRDPLDFLAKYCIISLDKLPYYEKIYNNVVSSQPLRYDPPLSPISGLPLKPTKRERTGKKEKNTLHDMVSSTRGMEPFKVGMSLPEQYLEKIVFTMQICEEKHMNLTQQLHALDSKKVALLAEKARILKPEIMEVEFKKKKSKKKKKKKKSKSPAQDDDEPVVFSKKDITDEVVVRRIDEKMMKQLMKEPDLYHLQCEMDRCADRLATLEFRLLQMDNERSVLEMYCTDYYFTEQTANERPVEFRRQQSALYNKLHPDPDVEMNVEDLEGALQSINSSLLSDREYGYLFHVLNLSGRRKINFKLFSVIAALSEKISQMDPVIRDLLNKDDYNALDIKMERSKELFALLENGDTAPYGNALASNLAVELTAGGLNPELTGYVMSKFNREGKGFVDFLDYVTYVPLFIEIHERIVQDPLRTRPFV